MMMMMMIPKMRYR